MKHSLDVLKNKMPIRHSKNGMPNLMNVPFKTHLKWNVLKKTI
jgi:hypothetical protein